MKGILFTPQKTVSVMKKVYCFGLRWINLYCEEFKIGLKWCYQGIKSGDGSSSWKHRRGDDVIIFPLHKLK